MHYLNRFFARPIIYTIFGRLAGRTEKRIPAVSDTSRLMDSYLWLKSGVPNQRLMKGSSAPITLAFEEGMPRDRATRGGDHELEIVSAGERSSRRAISCSSRVQNELIRSL